MVSSRRSFIHKIAQGIATASMVSLSSSVLADPFELHTREKQGAQRLSVKKLKAWESLGYGMFIHFGMSTYVAQEIPSGNDLALTYAPDKLDVDQWIAVAKEAGMKYAVLTTKHVAGHCLWPSKHTAYTVANSGDKTDVVDAFVKACRKYDILPGLYYCSWDNHNRLGSLTPSNRNEWNEMTRFLKNQEKKFIPYTSSLYQNFQTAQITELLNQYGPIAEVWIDIPNLLGPGYRTYLYNYIAQLQPDTVIVMNSGVKPGQKYDFDYAWPSDLMIYERNIPQEKGHNKWTMVEGKEYYFPAEVCDPIGKEWFYVEDDEPRAEGELLKQFQACRERGPNFLLDVGPDKHGVIPNKYVKALMILRKNAGI